MENLETNSATSSEGKPYKKFDNLINVPTRSSLGSSQSQSLVGSPKAVLTKDQFSFTERPQSSLVDPVIRKKQTNRVKNFHSEYLIQGLWPDINPKDQARFKAEYKNLNQRLSQKKKEVKELKNEVKNANQNCLGCSQLRGKNEATQAALKQAIELSNLLLSELKKDNKLY